MIRAPFERSRHHRWVFLLLPVIGLLLSASVVTITASPAAAADCSGSLVGHYPVRTSSGRTLAHVDIYYRSNGWNCVRLNSYDRHWGEPKYMAIELATCRETVDPGNSCTPLNPNDDRYYDRDAGWFSYYAGPVSVYAPNRCIVWSANVQSYEYGLAQTKGAGHCG